MYSKHKTWVYVWVVPKFGGSEVQDQTSSVIWEEATTMLTRGTPICRTIQMEKIKNETHGEKRKSASWSFNLQMFIFLCLTTKKRKRLLDLWTNMGASMNGVSTPFMDGLFHGSSICINGWFGGTVGCRKPADELSLAINTPSHNPIAYDSEQHQSSWAYPVADQSTPVSPSQPSQPSQGASQSLQSSNDIGAYDIGWYPEQNVLLTNQSLMSPQKVHSYLCV